MIYDFGEDLTEVTNLLTELSTRDLGDVSCLAKEGVQAISKGRDIAERLDSLMHACDRTAKGECTEDWLKTLAAKFTLLDQKRIVLMQKQDELEAAKKDFNLVLAEMYKSQ